VDKTQYLCCFLIAFLAVSIIINLYFYNQNNFLLRENVRLMLENMELMLKNLELMGFLNEGLRT